MSKGFLGVIAAIIIVFVGVVAFSGNSESPSGSGGDASKASEHVKGSNSTGVRLVEYGDFQCPYCQQYEPTLTQVAEKYKDQIEFQFRNFPLQSIHPNAFAASRAAEAAALQGKFWEMHDGLYSAAYWNTWTSAKNPNPEFERIAKAMGLDVAKFKTDFASRKVNDVVNADMAAGNKLKVSSTPTFVLNGKVIETPANNVEAFDKVIKEAIDKKAKSN